MLVKVPVVHLITAQDFNAWQTALRRLVSGYNMQGALLYTIQTV